MEHQQAMALCIWFEMIRTLPSQSVLRRQHEESPRKEGAVRLQNLAVVNNSKNQAVAVSVSTIR